MERSDELRDVVFATLEAFSSEDSSLIDRHTSRQEGILVISSDPDE